MWGIRTEHAALAVVGILLVAALAPAVAAQPSLDVRIDGAAVAGGETITATDDPTVTVDASANETIRAVRVDVDGTTRESFEPESETFSERLSLDLQDGEHDVSVVVEAAETRRLAVTVRKDSAAPLVTYRSPFESQGYPSGGEVTIQGANTTLVADLQDRSAIDQVRIERDYTWSSATEPERDRVTHRLKETGKNVSQPLLFGLGENDLQVEVIDAHGQRRTHAMTVVVIDGERPSIDLDRFERTGNGELRVEGTVSDDVKLNSLSYRVGDTGGSTFVVNPTTRDPSRDRLAVDFAFTASVDDETEVILLEATDISGRERRWQVPIDYRGHLEPTVRIDREATRVDGDGLVVEGAVDDGRVTRVVVEAIDPSGTVVDTVTAYEGEATERVTVRERIGVASGETTVVIRAVDATGRDHRASLTRTTPATPTTTAPPTTGASEGTPPETATATGGEGGATAGGGSGEDPEGSGPSVPLPDPWAIAALVGVVAVVLVARRAAPAAAGAVDGRRATAALTRTVESAVAVALAAVVAAGRTVRGVVAACRELTDGGSGRKRSREGGRGDGRGPDETGGDAAVDQSGVPPGTEAAVESLTRTPVEKFDRADVAALVTGLDADDPETVATAADRLGEVAGQRPELVEGSGATPRLRDLRVVDETVVSRAASRAVEAFDDAGIY